MKITVLSIGLLRGYSPTGKVILDFEENVTVKDLILILRNMWGEKFYNYTIEDDKLKPYIVILLNGLSIEIKDGLDTRLKDGDRLAFAILVNGG